MTKRVTHAAASPVPAEGTTDLERRVAASGHNGIDVRDDHIRVSERHGIWTVTAAGIFVGDYYARDRAQAAAAQARNRAVKDSDIADPWKRLNEAATP